MPAVESSCTHEVLVVFFFSADEDEPDELRREHGAPTGTRLHAFIPGPWWPRGSWGSWAPWLTGVSSKHASSADVQHGAPYGPWRDAAIFHAPWTNGPPLWTPTSSGPPSGHDGTFRHARITETSWPPKKHGSSGSSWYGTQRDAGAPWGDDGPPSSRNGSKGPSRTTPTGWNDAPSRKHDGAPGPNAGWSNGAPTTDTQQRAQQLQDGQHAGVPWRDAWAI